MKKVIATVLVFFSASAAYASIFQDNFDVYADDPTNHGWAYDAPTTTSYVSLAQSEGKDESRCLKVSYQEEGNNAWIGVPGDYSNIGEVYVRFYAKSSGPKSSAKFLKIFGLKTGTGYANTTLSMQPWDGTLGILHGGGETENDAANVIYLNGETYDDDQVIETSTTNFIPDNTWRCYEFYMKYNTNGNRDGVYKVWIDGVLRLHVSNVKNRHDLNTRGIWGIQLGGYTHGSATPWYLWYDNIVVSDQYVGVSDQASARRLSLGGRPIKLAEPGP